MATQQNRSYVLNPYGDYVFTFAKGNFAHLTETGVTSDDVQKLLSYVSPSLWAALFKTSNAINITNDLSMKSVSTLITELKEIDTNNTDSLSIDIVMQVMLQIENALKVATNTYHRFMNTYDASQNTNTATTDEMSKTMYDIYNTYYNH